MEQRPDYGLIHGISDHNYYIYSYSYEYNDRLHEDSKHDGDSESASCCDGERDPIDDLRWSEHDGYCHWRRHIFMERWPDDGLVHGNTHDHDDLHGHRYKR
jgi:hypothetical protein